MDKMLHYNGTDCELGAMWTEANKPLPLFDTFISAPALNAAAK